MSELELLVDLHRSAERQGPGSPEDTLKALEFIGISKNSDLKIADIGCGSGGQTLTLAENINGKITAVDLFPQFLDELDKRSEDLGLNEKITTHECPMEDLPFGKDTLDIIWSEGAIYIIGFETGIKKWGEFIQPNGYLCVSEVTWITNTRPKEIEDFWNQEYPEIDTASNKIKILEDNGYTLVGYFYLPQSSWIDHYYKPLEASFSSFLERHNHSEIAENVIKEHQQEIKIYQRFKDYYSYGFYIARKNQ